MSFRSTLAAPAVPALLAVAAVVLLALPLSAQPPAVPEAGPAPETEPPAGPPVEEEIVVTAGRVAEPAREAGSSVTVLDREEIERRGVTTVLELLRTVPGVEVSQGGGPGRVASVFVRGATSAQTLVLLDGVRLNSPATAAFDLAELTVDGVERVEVLRGPQSVLYGSEAMGGVIAVTTRRDGKDGLAGGAEVEGGSLGLAAARADLRGGAGRFEYSLAAGRLEMDGVSAASERRGNTEEDRWQNTTVAGRLGWGFGGDGRAGLTARYADGETGLDGFAFGVGPTDDPNYLQRRELTQVGLELSKPVTSRWRQEVTLATAGDRLVGEDPDTPFHPFDIRTRVAEASTRAELTFDERNRLLAGASFERREAENAGSFDESVDLASVFANHRWSWRERLFLTGGLRHDDASGFGSETTWRATGAWLVGGGARLHGSFGTGFRVPALNELFFPGLGNQELEPESSAGWDAGVERTFAGGRLRLDLTAFQNRFEDLIVFDLGSFTFANVARAESRGLELSAEAEPGERWDLAASWTWNETEDRATGEPLPRQPEHRGTLVASLLATERLRATATVVAVADRVDSDGSPMDDYERLDLAARYRLARHFEPYVRVDNLLDQGYEEVNGFTSPGRTVVLGMRAEL